jgi:hypothetical protein
MGRYTTRDYRPPQVQRSTRAPETHTPTPAPQVEQGGIRDLQRVLGNQGVQRLLAANPTMAQAKLTVGAADDAYEQEADRVASEVMTMQSPAGEASVQREGPEEEEEMQLKRADVQREAEEDELAMKRADIQRQEEEEELQLKRAPEIVQRAALGEEDELQMQRIQRAADEQDLTGSFDVAGELEGQINSQKGGGQGLDTGDKQFFESRFGQDFSDVKVHTGGESDAINRSIGARAFTNGSDVFMRGGEYSPGTSGSRELLAHELTHVVQQTGSRPLQPKREEGCDGC